MYIFLFHCKKLLVQFFGLDFRFLRTKCFRDLKIYAPGCSHATRVYSRRFYGAGTTMPRTHVPLGYNFFWFSRINVRNTKYNKWGLEVTSVDLSYSIRVCSVYDWFSPTILRRSQAYTSFVGIIYYFYMEFKTQKLLRKTLLEYCLKPLLLLLLK